MMSERNDVVTAVTTKKWLLDGYKFSSESTACFFMIDIYFNPSKEPQDPQSHNQYYECFIVYK